MAGTVTRLTGDSGSPVGFTEADARAGVPDEYVFVSLVNVINYDFNDAVDQTITVHLAQRHELSELFVWRTIQYVGAGASTPDEVVQPMTWAVDRNLVTGVTVYTTSATEYPAVNSPRLPDYTANIARVEAQPVVSPTNVMPVSETIIVTYRPIVINTGGFVTTPSPWLLLLLLIPGLLLTAFVGIRMRTATIKTAS